MFAGEIESVSTPCSHVLKTVGLLTPVAEVPGRDNIESITAVLFAKVFIDCNKLVRLCKRQWLQQHSAHDREERSGGADAESHDENGYQTETGRACEGACAVSYVAQTFFEPVPTPGGSRLVAHKRTGCRTSAWRPVAHPRGHAVRDVLGNLLVEMKLQFVIEPRRFSVTAKERQNSHAESCENAHLRLLLEPVDDEVDGGGEPAPVFLFALELRAAGGGERVELGGTASFGFAPFGAYPPLLLEAVKGGVEGALLHLQNFIGYLLDALGDGPAVFGLKQDGFEDQQVESALDEIAWFAHAMTIYTLRL